MHPVCMETDGGAQDRHILLSVRNKIIIVGEPIGPVLEMMRKTHQIVLILIFLLGSAWGCGTVLQKKDAADVGGGPGATLKRMTALMQTPSDQRPAAVPTEGASASPSSEGGGPGATLKQMIAVMGSPAEKKPTAITAGRESAPSSSAGDPVPSSSTGDSVAPSSKASLPDVSVPPIPSGPPVPAVPPAAAMAPAPLSIPHGEGQAQGTVRHSTLRTETAAVTPRIRDPDPPAPLRSRGEIFSAEPAYRLGPEDVIRVSVWESQELTTDATVGPDGKISLPLINDIQAAGLTPAELADAISQKLLEYIKDPHVTVVVTQLIATKIYVMGKVLKPGNYPLRQEMNVLQALSLAGGFTTFASPRSIKLIRGTGNGQEILKINYYKMIEESGEGNYMLKPGDTIVVP